MGSNLTISMPVAEGVEHGAYFHSFLYLFGQQVEQGIGNGVVAEVEVFQVYVVARLADFLKQVCKLVVPVHQQFHFVVVSGRIPHLLQVT